MSSLSSNTTHLYSRAMGLQNYQLTRNYIGEAKQNKSEGNICLLTNSERTARFYMTYQASKADALPDSKCKDAKSWV